MTPEVVVAVLGMHRSGTSCLTGLLEEAGLFLGEVSRWNPHNRKGNHEHPRVVALHEAILADEQASWDCPPPTVCQWSARRLRELDRLLAMHAHQERWGFKDPRTLLLLEGWLAQVPRMRFVASFRHPAAVVRSLMARNGGDSARWMDLWWHYNKRLIHFQDRFGFDLVCFDEPGDSYLRQVALAVRHLGLDSRRETMSFFEKTLRTQSAEEEVSLPLHVRNLYRELRSRSLVET